ncbi:MAG: hypothetical protein OEV78_12340 [Spirochaetia bacterium]|nr:hypothetical protein [Spirochaetia bacterium]
MIPIFDNILNKITEKNNIFRITGTLGVLGLLLILIADYKILYMPLSTKEYSTSHTAMAHSIADILFYTKLSVFAIPFVLFGLYHFYLTLSISNKLLAKVTVGAYAFGYLNAAFYYAYLAYIMSAVQLIVPLKLNLPYILKHLYFLFQIFYYAGIIAGSILFFLGLSFFKRINYPKWYIYFNPLYLLFIFRIILTNMTPPAFSGFFLISSFTLIMLITFIFSTVIIWKKSVKTLLPEV